MHTLVLLAFVGPRPDDMQACHNDGDKNNNRLSNLRWDFPARNHADKKRHGTQTSGEDHPPAKLTWDEVRIIRRLLDQRVSEGKIARAFGVTQVAISHIAIGKTWKEQDIA